MSNDHARELGRILHRNEEWLRRLGTVNGKLTAKMTEVTLVIANFKQDVAKPEIDAHRSFLTCWDPKQRCEEVIVGKILADFP